VNRSPMLLSFTIIISFLFCHGASAEEKPNPGPDPEAVECMVCHEEYSEVLSETHPTVSEDGLATCYSCHEPMSAGKAEPNPYIARLHQVHVSGEAELDCSYCHTWSPGYRFGVTGSQVIYGSPSERDMNLLKQIVISWAGSAYLDATHGGKQIACSGCHGRIFPTYGETVENDRCLSCHGSIESLAQKTVPDIFPDRNPHQSHLGVINCTVCHFAHAESKVYCLECHQKFQMTIPGGQRGNPALVRSDARRPAE